MMLIKAKLFANPLLPICSWRSKPVPSAHSAPQAGSGNRRTPNRPLSTPTRPLPSSTVTVLAVGLPPWRREVLGAAIPVVEARLLIAA